ncbi:MAG: serpin family protein [Bacteroidales bacterium]
MSLFINSCEKVNNGANKTEPIEIILTSAQTKIADNGNTVAFTYLANISEQEILDNKRENVMISPLSLNLAMAMCWNGADGQTKEQIKNTLGFVGNTDQDVNSFFKKMIETLPKTDPSVKLSIANSIWQHKDFAVLESFLATNKKWFNASIQSLDFRNSNSVNIINDWCSNNTNGMIKKIIDEIKPNEVLFLINALYFKAPWKNEFKEEKTTMQPFYLRDGSSKNVSTMNQEVTCQYSEGTNYRAATLPYGNEAFNMTIILPNEEHLPEDLFTILEATSPTTNSWSTIINDKTATILDIYLPKFKFEYEIEFNDILKKMGITDAFIAGLANFSRISSERELIITKVLQKTAIEVNEKGSEAAAVTSVGVGVTSMPLKNKFRVNRPFVFVISEKQTSAILFAGKVEIPS